MIFTLRYKDKCIYDIELYWEGEEDPELEVHSTVCPEGFIDYIMNVLKYTSSRTIEQFKKDCRELSQMRGWLYEQFKYKHPKKKDCRYDSEQYNLAAKHIEEVMTEFKKKYTSLKLVLD